MTYLPLAGSLPPFSGCYMLQPRQMAGMKQLTTCLPLLVLQTDYDDANVPSLLSIPLLGYPYDKEIYNATRSRILSSKNPLVRMARWCYVAHIIACFRSLHNTPDHCTQLRVVLTTHPPAFPQFYSGSQLRGIGSAHTRAGQVWPLALMVQGLTATAVEERAEMLRLVLKTQCSNGLMHESGRCRVLQALKTGSISSLPPVPD